MTKINPLFADARRLLLVQRAIGIQDCVRALEKQIFVNSNCGPVRAGEGGMQVAAIIQQPLRLQGKGDLREGWSGDDNGRSFEFEPSHGEADLLRDRQLVQSCQSALVEGSKSRRHYRQIEIWQRPTPRPANAPEFSNDPEERRGSRPRARGSHADAVDKKHTRGARQNLRDLDVRVAVRMTPPVENTEENKTLSLSLCLSRAAPLIFTAPCLLPLT